MTTGFRPIARPRLLREVVVALLVLVMAGCGNSAADDTASGDAEQSATPRVASESSAGTDTASASGMYDVGGHRLYMSCEGDGPVTVVYVHGWVNDTGYVPHDSATGISDLLAEDYRVCLYDRRNVGSSETVDAPQTPRDMLHDMESVLEAGGIDPPYILMAASFGGLVATSYLNEHPDHVTGMVLVDTMFPDELRLDRYLPRDFRFKYFDKDDSCCTLERISQYDLIRSLQRDIGNEPDIPVVYLASKQEPRNENDYESPKYDARVLDVQADYVDRFSPGILRWVDAPHFMEPVVPDVIADAVREVDRLGSEKN